MSVMDVISAYWLYVLGGYLLGSIPFGVLLTRMAGAGNLRAIGSGNIGATNVLRTGRKGLALATLLLDGGKGAVAVLITAQFSAEAALYAGVAAFLGHLYPGWLRFQGGKGVATYFGIVLALYWPIGLLALVTWLLIAWVSRMSSAAGMGAAALGPVYAYVTGFTDLTGPLAFMALFVLIRHRTNMQRILKGEEPKIGKG